MAVPTFGSASGDQEFSGSTTFTVTGPSSISAGDGLVALVWNLGGFHGSVDDLTPPSGWVTIAEIIIGNNPVAGLYSLISPSSSPALGWAMNDGGDRGGTIVRSVVDTFDPNQPIFTGVGLTSGVDYSLAFDSSAGTTVDAPAITPSVDECLGVALWCASTPFSAFTSVDGSWTQRSLTDNAATATAAATKDLTTSSTGIVQATAGTSVGANQGVGALVAIRPVVPPSAPTIIAARGGHERAGIEWVSGGAGSTPITDWDIDHATAAAPTTWLGPTATGSTNPYGAVTGLTNGTAYVFRVRGVNSIGDGAWSSTSSSATPSDVRGSFLLESGDKFLLENGDEFLLEAGAGAGGTPGMSYWGFRMR